MFELKKQISGVIGAVLAIFSFTFLHAHNTVKHSSKNLAANPAKLIEMDFDEFLYKWPGYRITFQNPEMQSVALISVLWKSAPLLFVRKFGGPW